MATRRKRNPVTEGQVLDLLAAAVARELSEPGRGWQWIWDRSMGQAERLAFDLFLVRTKDPLAWEAGTPESRFRARVQRMAELERQRKGNPGGGNAAAVRALSPAAKAIWKAKHRDAKSIVNGVPMVLFMDPVLTKGATELWPVEHVATAEAKRKSAELIERWGLKKPNPRRGGGSFGDVARRHQLKVARDTMRMHCAGARIMGGMDHPTAAALLGKPLPAGCTCIRPIGNPPGELVQTGPRSFVLRFAGRQIPGSSRKALESWAKVNGVAPVVFRDERRAHGAELGPEMNPGTNGAGKMFQRWHGFAPDQVADLPMPPVTGPLVFLGTLLRIDYDSPKWSKRAPGKRRQLAYTHKSTGRPFVMTNAAGNVVVIYDPTGQFKATARGLVK